MEIKFEIKKEETKFYKVELYLGDKKIGRAFLYIIKNDLHKEPYGLLEDLYVEEEFRGKGFGKMLVQKILEIAKEENCYKIIATSRFNREYVHSFYEKLGFIKWGYEFRKDLK